MSANNKIERMDNETLNAILDEELHDSVGFAGSKLSRDRRLAMEAYLGLNDKNDKKLDPAQSKYVSRDVQDTIEWIMPQMAEIFLSNEEVVAFEPTGPEDVESARRETLYTRYVIFRQNKGFTLIHNHIKDGLMQRMAIVKHWWDKSEKEEREEYENLIDEELQILLTTGDIEVIEHTARMPDGTETNEFLAGEGVLHDVTIIRKTPTGRVMLENVPPEEFKFSKRSRSKEDMDFCCHQTRKTVSELLQMGFNKQQVEKAARAAFQTIDSNTSEEEIARHSDDDSFYVKGLSERKDFAMRELDFEECYIRIDADGDGIAELRQISRIGKMIMINDPIEELPFTFFSPILMPHKLIGRSVADLVIDLQKLKSKLIRSMLDNIDQHNHGKWSVVQGMVNIDDLLTSRPQGIVRQKVQGAVQRLDSPNLPPEAFQMLSYVDGVREERTGVSRVQTGLDSKALGSNTASGAISQVMTASMQRILLIARVYAETSLKELVRSVHGLITRNEREEKVVRVTGKFIPVNPAEFKLREDLTVSAGVGASTKDSKLLHLTMLGQDLAMVAQMGGLESGLISPQNVYNLIAEKSRTMGFKDGDLFITDPSTIPPPTQEERNIEEEKLKVEAQIKQAELQIKQAELQIKQGQLEVQQGEIQLKAAELQLARQEAEHKARIAEAEFRLKVAELELEERQQRAVKIGN